MPHTQFMHTLSNDRIDHILIAFFFPRKIERNWPPKRLEESRNAVTLTHDPLFLRREESIPECGSPSKEERSRWSPPLESNFGQRPTCLLDGCYTDVWILGLHVDGQECSYRLIHVSSFCSDDINVTRERCTWIMSLRNFIQHVSLLYWLSLWLTRSLFFNWWIMKLHSPAKETVTLISIIIVVLIFLNFHFLKIKIILIIFYKFYFY